MRLSRYPASFSRVLSVDDEEVRAAAAGELVKRQYVRRIFSEIAPRYDLLNHILSFNIDRAWRLQAIEALAWTREPGGTYLDLCAGTLDVGVALASQPGFRGRVIGADFAEPMLRAGVTKARGRSLSPVAADALDLPLADQSMSGAIVAFGIRNVADLDAGLREVHRVLRAGSRFVILEFTTPPVALVRELYHLYFKHILPRVGAMVSGHPTAYRYLPESVARFPEAESLAIRMQDAGFSDVHWTRVTLGVAAIHSGTRA